ncbi:MAG: serine/threonine protein kinase [Acetanaerobacterium sp.]
MENNQFRGFKIIEELGSGAFSKTVLAEQNGKHAVIKIIEMPNTATIKERSADYVKSDEFGDAMRTAGTQLNRLLKTLVAMPQTTGLLRYYDYTLSLDSDKGIYTLAILMQHDTPLNALLATGEVPVGAILRMGSHLCEGLDAMQKKYVVHGNIKESNIFYNQKTGFMLGDFYVNDILSTSLVPDRGFKSYGYRFLAPEAYADDEYSFKTDIFSLGMMLYKIFNNNRLPFDDAPHTPLRKVKGSWDEAKVLPSPALDIADITKMLAKATAYNPEDRFSSYLQFKAVLDRLLATLPKEVLYTKLSTGPRPAVPVHVEEPDAAVSQTATEAAADSHDEDAAPIKKRFKRVAVQTDEVVAPPSDEQPLRTADLAARSTDDEVSGTDDNDAQNPLIPHSMEEEDQPPRADGRPVRPLVRHYEPMSGSAAAPSGPIHPVSAEEEAAAKRKRRTRIPNDSFNYFDYNSEEYIDQNPGKHNRRIVTITAIVLGLCVIAVAAGFLVKYMAG